MKYVMVKAPDDASESQKRITWTYICEGPGTPRPGSIVFGEFGYGEAYMEVVSTGTIRSRLEIPEGQARYCGPLKSCRLTTNEELRLHAETKKRWKGVSRAETRAMDAEAALVDYQERTFYPLVEQL